MSTRRPDSLTITGSRWAIAGLVGAVFLLGVTLGFCLIGWGL